MLWLGIFVLALVALAILILPSRLGGRGNDAPPRQEYDAAVYKDQLAEVGRDVERSLISETEAATARLEIQRRLLAMVDRETRDADPNGSGGERGPSFVIPVISLLAFAAALVLYLDLGSPGTPDFPYASRDDLEGESSTVAKAAQSNKVAEAAPEMEAAVTQLEARLQANPDDPEGWMMLGRTYLTLKRYQDAQKAFLSLFDITGDIMAKAEYAEALILSNSGEVTPEALEIFQEVLRVDPLDPKSRFYFGMSAAQQGNLEGAVQTWTDLLHLSPADAPWVPIVRQQILRAATEAGLDPADLKPTEMAVELAESADIQSAGGMSVPVSGTVSATEGPGPSQEDIKNAQQMTDDEQLAMIRSMVQRLADRLADNPNDPEGWVRLAQAYEVLGETENAVAARRRAAEVTP